MSLLAQRAFSSRFQRIKQDQSQIVRTRSRGLLLDLPIRWRLTIGFLIAALIVSLAAGISDVHYIQSLNTLSNFYQYLLQCNENLSTGNNYLQLMDTKIHETLDDALAPAPSRETLATDLIALHGLMDRYDAIITASLKYRLLAQHPDQVALLAQTGNQTQVAQQRNLLGSVVHTWHIYRMAQVSVMQDIAAGKLTSAQTTERLQAEPTQADALSSLRELIHFTQRLSSSIHEAVTAEARDLWMTILLTSIAAFLSTVLVGLFISKPLVERLRLLSRITTQALQEDQATTPIAIIGHDEIAAISTSINALLEAVTLKRQITAAYEQQQQLNQLKDQFILNVSHELRTPLTEVYGYLELLNEFREQLGPAQQATFIQNAMHGCNELILLVGSILEAASASKEVADPRCETFSVSSLVSDVLEQLDPKEKQNHPLQVDIPDALTVWADRHYTRRVLRNLLSNAFKYSPHEAPVTIQAREHTVTGQAADILEQVCISVKDGGPGIPASELPLLFQKFVRLKRDLSGSVRGTGLGLYISKQLVEAMHGQIWVESSGVSGEGSNFLFTLPLSPSEGAG